MRPRRHILIALLVLVTHARVAPGADAPPLPDIDVVVNPAVPTESFDRAALAAVFNMTRRSWGGGLTAVPFNYPPEHPLRRTFDQAVLGLAPAEVGRFWIDQRIRGFGHPPRQIPEPALLLRLVGSLKGSIGYVPAGLADKSVRVVAKIRKGKVVAP
jgi:hypothetical protein